MIGGSAPCDVEQLRGTEHVDSPSRALGRVKGTATAAARRWLAAHRGLPAGLGRRARPGPGCGARPQAAVTFRQRAGSSPLLDGGLVTVALRRAKAVVERRLCLVVARRTSADRGQRMIDAKDAWRRAARSVGHRLRRRQPANGCERLDVHVPTVCPGSRASGVGSCLAARRADTGVRDRRLRRGRRRPGELSARPDARNGRVLLRQSTVDHAADNPCGRCFPATRSAAWTAIRGITRAPTSASSGAGRRGPACDLAVSTGSPHAGVSWDTVPPGGSTFTTTGNNLQRGRRWGNRAQAARCADLPTDESDARLRLSVDERVVHVEVRSGELRPG